jgi:uncharacterized protein (DUF2225 family)
MSINSSKIAKMFRTLNHKEQNLKYNKKDHLSFFILSNISGRKRRP